MLSYDLIIKDVFVENIKFVTEFSKKSGDYPSLSAVDIKVVALAYQLEKEIVGDSHLNTVPKIQKNVSAYKSKPNESKNAMGFFVPVEKKTETVTENMTAAETEEEPKPENDIEEDLGVEETESVDLECESIQSKLASLQMTEEDESENILVPISNNEDDNDEDDEIDEGNHLLFYCNFFLFIVILIFAKILDVSSDDDEDDGDDWITIDNLEQMKKKMDNGLYIEDVSTVACMTADFAMQNVLKQIGLNVSAYDGRLIRMVRTFILRCITCFKTTSVMTKTFCPNCGHASLKKVSVSLDENGKQQIFINTRRPLTARGKRFSLPAPRGGPHAQNPILNADQAFPRCKPTKLARTKNNPLNTDYIAGKCFFYRLKRKLIELLVFQYLLFFRLFPLCDERC